MRITELDYHLPPEKIAQYPPEVRGNAKLLVLHKTTGNIEHRRYTDLPEYLDKDDLIIRNNTKVIPARLYAMKENDTRIELLLLEKHPNSPNLPNTPTEVIYRGKLTPGDTLVCHDETLTVMDITPHGTARIQSTRPLIEIAQEHGEAPIPPYLKRDATPEDKKRYQTVFAQDPGSVAAPTASLNFTKELEQTLRNNGVLIEELTLHVGRGTFLPVKTNNVEDHTMHQEFYTIPPQTTQTLLNTLTTNHRVVALGTTVTRALEHAAPVINHTPTSPNTLIPIQAEADIFIYPGYEFQIVDVLLTNFHAPKSTVLLLAAAFAGKDNLLNAYEEALANNYKFLSYGDSMLII